MIPNQRHLFDIPDGVTYLNCAYLSPLLNEVRAAGERGVARKAHPWTIARRDFHGEVEAARGLFARLIGATADDVAIVGSTSYGVAVAGANLPLERGQNVVVLEDQHGSNFHQWRVRAEERGAELRTVPRPADGDWTAAVLERLDGRTGIAALPNIHWTDGGLVDLALVGRRCRELGAALVVDGTQSVGAMPFDVAEVRPDFLVCSAYKWLLCPYTLGFLYAAPHRQGGRPIEEHGFSRRGTEAAEGRTAYLIEFQPGARRYDMGERSNFISLPMALVALERLHAWGVPEIAASLAPLVEAVADQAVGRGFVVPPEGHRAPHMIGVRAGRTGAGFDVALVERLAAAGVYVSVRGGAIRVSPHLYNDAADVARLFDALDRSL